MFEGLAAFAVWGDLQYINRNDIIASELVFKELTEMDYLKLL